AQAPGARRAHQRRAGEGEVRAEAGSVRQSPEAWRTGGRPRLDLLARRQPADQEAHRLDALRRDDGRTGLRRALAGVVRRAVAVAVAAVAGVQLEVDARIVHGVAVGPSAAHFQQQHPGIAAILQVVAVRIARGETGAVARTQRLLAAI